MFNHPINRRESIRILSVGGLIAGAGTIVGGCEGLKKLNQWSANAKQHCAIDKPNFIIILTDDQGYADVGCFGAKGFTTPNLDLMAKEGMRFTDFYVAAPVCTPSRAALMTGCYPQRVSLPNVLMPRAKQGISAEEETIAQILKNRGYATACYGKWHLGDDKRFLPMRHGFDDYFGLPYSNDMRPDGHLNKQLHFPDLPLIEGENAVEYNPDQTKLTTVYTEHSIQFIESHKDVPFFLYLAHTMPHIPLHVSNKFKGKSKQGLYGDVIMEIDWSVGQIMSVLKRLGIDEQTFVIFLSDNGPWLVYGDNAGSALPLREGKTTTFDGGQRVPCIMRWPGIIPAGRVCGQVVSAMDILPTVAKAAGAELSKKPIDGKDVWPLITGQASAESPHEALFYYNSWELQAVRSGKWKLHLPHKYNCLIKGGTGGQPGVYERKEIEMSLFDLEKDIGEQNNVAAENLEVVKRLLTLVDKMRKELGDSAVNIKGTDVRPPGVID